MTAGTARVPRRTRVEFSGGVATQRHAAFRAYGSIEESVSDFANLLAELAPLQGRRGRRRRCAGLHQGIGKSGYATDPEYANKLNDILNSSTLRMALNINGEKL